MYTTTRSHSLWHRFHHRVFNALYSRNLIYNTCWEDPAVDRQVLNLDGDSEVMVITSAGCNALDYALDAPRAVHAIDYNPRQNALLDLKMAGIRNLEHEDFFKIFGHGRHLHFKELYRTKLRKDLPMKSREIWDENTHWFTHENTRKSFYGHGLSGILAKTTTQIMRSRPALWAALMDLMNCRDLEEQRRIYDTEVEKRLMNKPMNWMLNRQVTMSMLGVPYPQREAVKASHADGVAGFIRSCLAYICRELPFHSNYFWKLYILGHYEADCCPNYLTKDGFEALKGGLVDRVHTHTGTVTDFMRADNGADLNRFVLLDHMDWMSHAFPQALEDEWNALFDTARSDSRVLFRSAMEKPAFLDSCTPTKAGTKAPLREHLNMHDDLAERLHREDRVHTYAGFVIADVKS